MINNQQKKVTFEPTLLIYDGNEVSAQERRNQLNQQQQSHLTNDLYQGVQDIIFMGNQQDPLDGQMLGLDKDNGSNYSNGNNQYFVQQNINYAAASQNYGKKNSQNNNGERFNSQSSKAKANQIKQSKSLNDMNALISNNPLLQQSNSFQYQQNIPQQPQQQAPSNPTISRNNSAEGLAKLASNPNIQISNIKSNVKNTYIKKISSLMNVVQSNGDLQNMGNEKSGNIKQEIRESDDDGDGDSNSKSFDQKGDDSQENKRLKKNRESARNSRQRKKIYIDLLEKKVTELTKEIEEVCVYIEKSQSGISSILSHNPYLRGLVLERLNFIEKIQKNIGEPKPNEDELNLVVDSFRLRLGATGRIRQHAINLFFKHMYKSFLENNYEYFLYGYEQNQDDDEEFNRCVEIFKDTIGLPENDNQIYSALPILKKFLEHRKSFKKAFREMKNIQKEWITKTTSVENLVDKISPLLTATQVGKLIDFIDKKRQQPELNSMKRKYNQITSQQMASSFAGQFNTGNSSHSLTVNNYQSFNQQLMTPSQILSANNALGNTQSYQNNGNNIGGIPQYLKNNFPNQEFGGNDNGLGNLTDDPAQNFYNQIQFQNYRMYQPVFQISQPSYFPNQMQNPNQAAQPNNPINNLNQNDIQNNPMHHHPHHMNQPGNQHLQNHQIQQPIARDNTFLNQNNQNQTGLTFFDMIPQQTNDDRDTIKQPIGSLIQNNEHYFVQDNIQKKRKQY
ncbi:bZIP transcription factor (macronuclear) [Tetrahymena thermophila SB210]|uniref:BZIP transcription factor n=1 Tax=Tetrahymena thermophila (strain SB210) TaxID=312017 RepID=I7LTN0_TETTS|nr:bZIP transcription factor [Tetrahymena thermophila SB210]EAR85543.2 bZIP transcription factor [Tetrahymena thermophila SB210]|eukprot:XP_001033206.2 bZIP transcription factor [Tetrahymena thermophila SB210]